MDTQRGETIHLLHPDGTVTVQFITAEDVQIQENYIDDGGEDQQYITTDGSGDYITTAGGSAYILAINSDGQLVAGAPDEFISGSAAAFDVERLEDEHEEAESVEVDDVKLSLPLENQEQEPEEMADISLVEERDERGGDLEEHTEAGPAESEPRSVPSPSGQAEQDVEGQSEQERQKCANCYNKLVFQRARSKKFSDPLYPLRESPGSSQTNKHAEKEVTVLEALDLLFDLTAKSSLSSIGLSHDYVFCHKCVSSLTKLHTLFIDFTEASKSPSFMKSIFSQFGVLTEFGNVIEGIASEPNTVQDVDSCKTGDTGTTDSSETLTTDIVDRTQKPHKELRVSVSKLPECKSNFKKQIYRQLSSKDPLEESNKKLQIRIGRASESKTKLLRSSGRFPRSCKRLKNYRAMAKVGPYKDKDLGSDDDDEEDAPEVPSFPKDVLSTEDEEDDDELTKNLTIRNKCEARNRLLNLKNRIKLTSESSPPVKRKRGRPRKIKLEPEMESIQIKVEPGAILDSMKAECEENGDELTETELDELLDTGENLESSPSRHSNSSVKKLKQKNCDDEDWGREEEEFYPSGDEEDLIKDVNNEKKIASSTWSLKKRIKCKHCCATFLKPSHYAEHLKVHNDKAITCTYCQGRFNTTRNLRRHISLNHRAARRKKDIPRRFTCTECSFSFTRLYHLKSHLVNQHQIDPESMLGNFACPVCPKRYINDSSLQAHLQRNHLVRIREMKNKCDECGRKFLKKSDMENHMTTHTNIRRFMCEVCGFSSKRPQDLTRHRKLVHTKEVKHICATCGKGYLSLWQMKAHQLSHDERKAFPCPEPGCGKAFRCPNNLRQHIHVHQGTKHVCQYCGESYSRTAYLARHININHLGNDGGGKADANSSDGIIQKISKPRKPKRTYQLMENVIEILQPEPMELELDLPTEDGHTQQVILHGFDDRYDGVIMEYIIDER